MNFATMTQHDSIVISAPERFDFRMMRDFDVTTSSALRDRSGEVVVDLSRTTHMDTSALAMLLVFRDRARSNGKSVVLARARGTVREVMGIARFDQLFEFR